MLPSIAKSLLLGAWAVALAGVANTAEIDIATIGSELRIASMQDLTEPLNTSNSFRVMFARIALEEMIQAYDEELLRLTDEFNAKRVEADVSSGWFRATTRFIEDLTRIASGIGDETPVEIVFDDTGGIRMLVGDESVIVSSPRLTDSQGMERRILQRLCERTVCEPESKPLEQRAAERTARVRGVWSFSDRHMPEYTTRDGLNCGFSNSQHLNLKQRVCEGLLNELWLTVESLRALRLAGTHLDWADLKILPGGTSRPHRVVVNRQADFVELELPMLFRLDDRFNQTRPWIVAKLQDETVELKIPISEGLVYSSN